MRDRTVDTPPQAPTEVPIRRRETIRALNVAYWTAAREAALADPVYATIAYGIDAETADLIRAMTMPELALRASAMVAAFKPVGQHHGLNESPTDRFHSVLAALRSAP
jgi:hypothetical protein